MSRSNWTGFRVALVLAMVAASTAAVRAQEPATVEALAGMSVHEDAPAQRWLRLVRDGEPLQRLVAIDELARAARFDSRAAALVRVLAADDADENVKQKASDIAPRLIDRMTVHVRHSPAASAADTANGVRLVRIGWKQYPIDELDIFAAALNHRPDDAEAARRLALGHGLDPAAGGAAPRSALVLAGGDETWAELEPVVQALAQVYVGEVAAVSTTAAGITPDRTNIALSAPSRIGPPEQPIKVVLSRESGELVIRVVGLSDAQPSVGALARVLRALLRSQGNPTGPYSAEDPVVLDVGRDVRWLDVVETANAVKTAGYETVRLAQVRVRERGVEIDDPAPGETER